MRVATENLKDEDKKETDILKATTMEIVNTMRDLLTMSPLYGEQFKLLVSMAGACVALARLGHKQLLSD